MISNEVMFWIRKGVFSFIIGFIITIILGVLLAIAFANSTYQGFLLYGGLPLTWLRIVLGIAIYDYFAFTLDLIFWTFIVFLIVTRKKKIKTEKENNFLSYFSNKLDKKEILKVTVISVSIAIAIIFITLIMGLAISSQVDPIKNQYEIRLGLPLSWFNITHREISSTIIEVSNWVSLIVDFIFYSAIIFILGYIGDTYWKNRKILKMKK